MGRLISVLKVVGVAILLTGFVVSWGIILAKGYGISDAPIILLSSINALAVVSLAWFTYSYMKSTELMANEMRRTNELAFELNHRPKVSMWFDVKSNGAVYIVVGNEGNGPARNI